MSTEAAKEILREKNNWNDAVIRASLKYPGICVI